MTITKTKIRSKAMRKGAYKNFFEQSIKKYFPIKILPTWRKRSAPANLGKPYSRDNFKTYSAKCAAAKTILALAA